MAKLFRITPAIRRLSQNAIDTMISELGKDCLLAFDSPQTECPNCHFDTVTRQSNGVYNGTGPRPFTRPPCPVCRGKGLVGGGESFEVVRFLIDWQPKTWFLVDATGTKVPQGAIQAKGYVTDMPLVLRAKYLVVDYLHAKYESNRFILWGEPTPQGNIVANRYMTTFWTRAG